MGTGGSVWGCGEGGGSRPACEIDVKLTNHLHLAPWLKISGVIPLLILHEFMAWRGKPLRFHHILSHYVCLQKYKLATKHIFIAQDVKYFNHPSNIRHTLRRTVTQPCIRAHNAAI
jgi:hypothetical protein